ncbi:HAD-IC family P-type ATPase [Enterococcus sp. DIV0876]|uniref:HAD-IC family P-type ATPase n=1 Tax=Enterococcus sp. DIV0876 TaxID=2774633 RepID=UPI003D2FB946
MTWYKKTTPEIIEELQTNQNGLTMTDRQTRLTEQGENVISETQQIPKWRKLMKHFTDLLMVVLMVAAILKAITGDYAESGIIFAVVVINGLVGYWQERKAEASLNGLKQLMGKEATIYLHGRRKKVPVASLVAGDLVVLGPGDVVPADLRLMMTHDLVIEESILTGESEPVHKKHDTIDSEAIIGDQHNMAFSGTHVESGSATGIVVETGDHTQIGQINQAIQSVETQETPLIKKMKQLNHQLFRCIIALVLFLIFFTTIRYGFEVNVMFSSVIALIVAMIPEGLPAVLTMILSMGVKEMSEQQAIIKTMPSVETLGAMTVICSDKTGTLTKNQMTVVEVISEHQDDHARVIDIMTNCQDIKQTQQQKAKDLVGNPTEKAILHYAEAFDQPLKTTISQLPFNSAYKYMATLHPIDEQKKAMLFVKGAPEVLLSHAHISEQEKQKWLDRGTKLASQGQRLIGFAYKEVSVDHILTHDSVSGLTFTGLAGIIDPPKESAIRSVKECLQAGIQVKMITGDHADTAQAIGKQIGLKHTDQVLQGIDIDHMSEEELQKAVNHVDIYARTTPAHKLKIVTALQKNGEIVGMTGDGVNDAPALKKADIGIAMGIKGSEVTKQAADMVLADDNFHTIAHAVKEGRRIYDNLKKTILFFLPTAFAQGLIVILALLLNRPLPLTSVQILWVNMVTTITLSYALGFEKASKDAMRRPPRLIKEGILNGYSFFRIAYVSLLIMIPAYWLAIQFDGTGLQQSILLQNIVIAQAVYLINCRELLAPAFNRGIFKNRALLISFAALIVLQTLALGTPFGQQLLGVQQLSFLQHLTILANGILLFGVVEVEKWFSAKYQKRQKAAPVNLG